MTEREIFLVTGHTGKGKSHNPKFKAGKPNPFPLFKLHSVNPEEIVARKIPPARLVTSMKFGATKRLSVFIDAILNPIAKAFCGKQYLKDTPDFLRKLAKFEGDLCRPGVQLFTLDVKALYPNINPVYVPTAVEVALDVTTDFSTERKNMIINLVKFSISNATVHYRDCWYKMLEGVPTGGSDSVCLANIYMKWVVMKFSSTVNIAASNFSCSITLLRYIDDLFGGWLGTYRQFKHFISSFNNFGKEYGITFDKEQFGDTVNFLDVLVSNNSGSIVTDLYIKPTDARRYLHRSSFHPGHTFSGIPFSQMRRAALICSNTYLRDLALDDMFKQFLECGYKLTDLTLAKNKVQQLNRNELLEERISLPNSNDVPLCFVLSHSVDVKAIKHYVRSFSDEIQLLTGNKSIMFSLRRNSNTSALLFNKYGFSQNKKIVSSQKCGVTNCDSCLLKLPNCSHVDILPNFTIKPSRSLTCKSECVIYLALCKLCADFYIGRTMNEEHLRMNGHREKFHPDKYDKSALAMHIFNDHPEHIGQSPNEGLLNYNVILLETGSAENLRRRESYYIWATKADIKHLNRYKVLR